MRIEWAEGGARITRLNRYDPLTQRSTGAVASVVAHPATEGRPALHPPAAAGEAVPPPRRIADLVRLAQGAHDGAVVVAVP